MLTRIVLLIGVTTLWFLPATMAQVTAQGGSETAPGHTIESSQTASKAHVVVVMLDAEPQPSEKVSHGLKLKAAFASSLSIKSHAGQPVWQSVSGAYRQVHGRAPNVAAWLYGQEPLALGVVCDLDWRRKPVRMKSIANHYRETGYGTVYWGEWGLGESAQYHPLQRGFDRAAISSTGLAATNQIYAVQSNSPTDSASSQVGDLEKVSVACASALEKNRPLFCVLRQGRYLTEEKIAQALKDHILPQLDGPTMVLLLRSLSSDDKPQLDKVPETFFQPARWTVYYQKNHAGFAPALETLQSSQDVWQMHDVLLQLLGQEMVPKKEETIYHKGGWPIADSPEKYRFRNSVILGRGFALLDGMKLYPLDGQGLPDLSKPMDVGEHAQLHQSLLSAYGKWWQGSSRAIRNPRPFDVGAVNHKAVLLTALDWRGSKTIRADGSSPSSVPVRSIRDLESMIQGIQRDEKYKQSFPGYSGSWSVNIIRSGRYKITARLLNPDGVGIVSPPALQGGQAHIKLGSNEVRLRLIKGATSVSVTVDAEQGVSDLECWFTGQLSLERELGAFFVEIERVDDKKFKLKASPSAELKAEKELE